MEPMPSINIIIDCAFYPYSNIDFLLAGLNIYAKNVSRQLSIIIVFLSVAVQ